LNFVRKLLILRSGNFHPDTLLVIEREGHPEKKDVRFVLIGTMNPGEGLLRPQLIDRFGLMVDVTSEPSETSRVGILETVLRYDEARWQEKQGAPGEAADALAEARRQDESRREILEKSRERLTKTGISDSIKSMCARLGALSSEGHRADYLLAVASRALAARDGVELTPVHLAQVAQIVLQHRRPSVWSASDTEKVKQITTVG
jgi:magnesium chelatase subunit I